MEATQRYIQQIRQMVRAEEGFMLCFGEVLGAAQIMVDWSNGMGSIEDDTKFFMAMTKIKLCIGPLVDRIKELQRFMKDSDFKEVRRVWEKTPDIKTVIIPYLRRVLERAEELMPEDYRGSALYHLQMGDICCELQRVSDAFGRGGLKEEGSIRKSTEPGRADDLDVIIPNLFREYVTSLQDRQVHLAIRYMFELERLPEQRPTVSVRVLSNKDLFQAHGIAFVVASICLFFVFGIKDGSMSF